MILVAFQMSLKCQDAQAWQSLTRGLLFTGVPFVFFDLHHMCYTLSKYLATHYAHYLF